ncbi:MAG TPA: hypothetical protein VL523_13890, partial [Terriglobia bacterium]|nr:hypothetical protein [Terriglobia bacterium]
TPDEAEDPANPPSAASLPAAPEKKKPGVLKRFFSVFKHGSAKGDAAPAPDSPAPKKRENSNPEE